VPAAGGAVLASLALYVPLLVAAVTAASTSGVAADVVEGRWLLDWQLTVVTGAVACAALVVSATRSRSVVQAAQVPLGAAVTVLLVLVAERTPDLATLLAVPVFALGLQLAALATSRDVFWSRVTHATAVGSELLGLLVLPAVVLLAIEPWPLGGLAPDPEVGLAVAVIALGWGVAGSRRAVVGGWRRAPVVGAAALAVLHVAAAIAAARPGSALTGWVLLAAVVLSLGWLRRPSEGPTLDGGWLTAIGVGVLGAGLVVAHAWTSPAVLALGIGAVAVLGLHVWAAARCEPGDAATALAVLLPATVGTTLFVAAAPGAASVPAAWRAAGAAAVLLGVAHLADRVPVGADLVRVAAALVAVVSPAGPVRDPVLDPDQAAVLTVFGPGPDALAVSLVVAGWLLVDAWWRRRPWLVALAAPVAVRAVLSLVPALGLTLPGTGMVLLLAGGALLVAAGLVHGTRWPWLVAGVVVALPGWALLGAEDHLRAWTLVAYGAATVAAGLVRREAPVAHVGGIVTTLGVWWLLSLEGIVAADLWVLPIAVHLWVAGRPARRGGTSSWVTEVPPLLLVVVPALAERLAGGAGWHALLAGTVAVAAVAYGGWRRLGGPLVVGSIAVVAVALVETFALVASVPTWVWLALAGTVLLAVAVAIERTGTSPVASARRLVEVIDERFD
jgi:hypothetical protein